MCVQVYVTIENMKSFFESTIINLIGRCRSCLSWRSKHLAGSFITINFFLLLPMTHLNLVLLSNYTPPMQNGCIKYESLVCKCKDIVLMPRQPRRTQSLNVNCSECSEWWARRAVGVDVCALISIRLFSGSDFTIIHTNIHTNVESSSVEQISMVIPVYLYSLSI